MRRPAESNDRLYANPFCSVAKFDHRLGRALANAFWFAVAPNVRGQHAAVSFVYQAIADGLTDKVRRNRDWH
jgi:hypothetical protein